MKPTSLFEQVLGDSYSRLPCAVQRFHRLSGHRVLHGWVETRAPATRGARVLAAALGTPRGASRGPIRFELTAQTALETWTRHFPSQTMTSRLRPVRGRIEEHLGAARLTFQLVASRDGLSMQLIGLRFLGLPCPAWMMPRVVAEEHGDGDRLHFHITADLPLVGRVAGYQGHLELRPEESA